MDLRVVTISAVLAAMTSISAMSESRYVISSKLDSAHLIMGRQTTLHLQVVGNLDGQSGLNTIDTMWHKVEIVSMGKPMFSDIGNGQKRLTQDVVIQSFEPGLYPIPPFFYSQNGDTAVSERPALKVIPVDADSLNNFENVVSVKSNGNLIDTEEGSSWIYWIIAAILIIGAGVLAYFKWFKTGKIAIPLLTQKKQLPPYELAVQNLVRLREEHLCEKGAEKLYYTKLIDILRQYLQGRFGINAMEMTSNQIMNSIRSADIATEVQSEIDSTLELSDFVKFAKVKPTPGENEQSYKSVYNFVEITKPVETADSETSVGTREEKKQ